MPYYPTSSSPLSARRRSSTQSSTSSDSSMSSSEPTPAPVMPRYYKRHTFSRRRNQSLGEAAIAPALLFMRAELFTPKESSIISASSTHTARVRSPSPLSPLHMPAITITDEDGNEEAYHDVEPIEEGDVSPVMESQPLRIHPLESHPLGTTVIRRRRERSSDVRGRGRGRGRSRERESEGVKIEEREIIE